MAVVQVVAVAQAAVLAQVTVLAQIVEEAEDAVLDLVTHRCRPWMSSMTTDLSRYLCFSRPVNLPPGFVVDSEASVFKLFFTPEIVADIVKFTNAYADAHIDQRPSYKNKDGLWTATTSAEMYKLLALLLHMAYLPRPELADYYKTTSLFAGGYARLMIPSHKRFKALMSFLKVVDHTTENPEDRLRKVRHLIEHFRPKCRTLFKPSQNIAVDERMIRCKDRASFIQYMPAKPTKWGFKAFALCDSASAILCDFEIYTGQGNAAGGLAHDVVIRLVEYLGNQHHVVYVNNFYTSEKLLMSLKNLNTSIVGTIRQNRIGFPAGMKIDSKRFEKWAARGTIRYIRKQDALYVQWKDKRCVSVLSSIHRGNSTVMVARETKDAQGHFLQIDITQPRCITDYNRSMGGVDTFDQLIETYRTLRRTRTSWKSIFYDLIDVAAVNSFRYFEIWRANHPGQLPPTAYSRHSDFQSGLIRQLAEFAVDEPPPKRTYVHAPPPPAAPAAEQEPAVAAVAAALEPAVAAVAAALEPAVAAVAAALEPAVAAVAAALEPAVAAVAAALEPAVAAVAAALEPAVAAVAAALEPAVAAVAAALEPAVAAVAAALEPAVAAVAAALEPAVAAVAAALEPAVAAVAAALEPAVAAVAAALEPAVAAVAAALEPAVAAVAAALEPAVAAVAAALEPAVAAVAAALEPAVAAVAAALEPAVAAVAAALEPAVAAVAAALEPAVAAVAAALEPAVAAVAAALEPAVAAVAAALEPAVAAVAAALEPAVAAVAAALEPAVAAVAAALEPAVAAVAAALEPAVAAVAAALEPAVAAVAAALEPAVAAVAAALEPAVQQ